MVVTGEAGSVLNVFVQEYFEWIRVWLLVSWSLDDERILISLICITKVKDHRPLLRIELCDLSITESNCVDLRSSIEIILDHLLEVDVREHEVENAWIEIPWWIENNGIVACHGKGVLDR